MDNQRVWQSFYDRFFGQFDSLVALIAVVISDYFAFGRVFETFLYRGFVFYFDGLHVERVNRFSSVATATTNLQAACFTLKYVLAEVFVSS